MGASRAGPGVLSLRWNLGRLVKELAESLVSAIVRASSRLTFVAPGKRIGTQSRQQQGRTRADQGPNCFCKIGDPYVEARKKIRRWVRESSLWSVWWERGVLEEPPGQKGRRLAKHSGVCYSDNVTRVWQRRQDEGYCISTN
jgi:hypothetical protein